MKYVKCPVCSEEVSKQKLKHHIRHEHTNYEELITELRKEYILEGMRKIDAIFLAKKNARKMVSNTNKKTCYYKVK